METVVALRSEALAKGEALKVAEAEKGRLAADAAAPSVARLTSVALAHKTCFSLLC